VVNGKHCLAIAARKMENDLLDWLEWLLDGSALVAICKTSFFLDLYRA
jgi:hypothetical protein